MTIPIRDARHLNKNKFERHKKKNKTYRCVANSWWHVISWRSCVVEWGSQWLRERLIKSLLLLLLSCWSERAAGGCRWFQVVAGGCRWLQVVAGGVNVSKGRKWVRKVRYRVAVHRYMIKSRSILKQVLRYESWIWNFLALFFWNYNIPTRTNRPTNRRAWGFIGKLHFQQWLSCTYLPILCPSGPKRFVPIA